MEQKDSRHRREKELRDIIETIPVMAWTCLPDGSHTFRNGRWAEYSGLSVEDATPFGGPSIIHPEDLAKYTEKWRASLETGQLFENEARYRRAADGQYRWFLSRAVPLRDERGNIVKWYGILTDIEDRKRTEALLAGERRILEMLAKEDSLSLILDALCRLLEQHARDALASVLLIEDGRLKHGGAPSLPRAYIEAIDGVAIGPSVGSCGTAAYLARQVIVSDIANDPLWADYRDAALPHSLRACCSTPIMSSEGKVIGTFAMYYREPRTPSLRDQQVIQQITHLAGIAIQRKLTENALRASEQRFRQYLEVASDWLWESGPDHGFTDFSRPAEEWGFPRDLIGKKRWELAADYEEEPEKWRAHIATVEAHQPFRGFRYRVSRSDRSAAYVSVSGRPVFDDNGKFLGYRGVTTDVTMEVRAEEALRASEERFRALVQFSFDVYWESDAQHRFVRQEFSEGLSDAPAPGSEIGKTRWEVPYLEPDEEAWRKHRETLDAHLPFRDFELARPAPDGGKRYVSVSGLPVFDEAGHFIGYRGVGRHITARKPTTMIYSPRSPLYPFGQPIERQT